MIEGALNRHNWNSCYNYNLKLSDLLYVHFSWELHYLNAYKTVVIRTFSWNDLNLKITIVAVYFWSTADLGQTIFPVPEAVLTNIFWRPVCGTNIQITMQFCTKSAPFCFSFRLKFNLWVKSVLSAEPKFITWN